MPAGPHALAAAIALMILVGLAILPGCGTSFRSKPTHDDLQAQITRHRAELSEQHARFLAEARARIRLKAQARAASGPPITPEAPLTYDILVLSGGGQYGAFGAGFMNGWGECADPAARRPEFDAVTGISTGSLIAPFAFVGSDEAHLRVMELYGQVNDGMAPLRDMLFFLPWRPSFFDNARLSASIQDAIDAKLMAQAATRYDQHALLLVGSTNLDLGSMRVWDVVREMRSLPDPEGLQRAQRILLASCAVPAIFPPVAIDGELHADGGVSEPLFLHVEVIEELADKLCADPDLPPTQIRVWLVMNGKIAPPVAAAGSSWLSVAERSIKALAYSSKAGALRRLYWFCQYQNTRRKDLIRFRYVAIPDEIDLDAKPEQMFDQALMRTLADLGRTMGRSTSSWRDRPPPAEEIDSFLPPLKKPADSETR